MGLEDFTDLDLEIEQARRKTPQLLENNKKCIYMYNSSKNQFYVTEREYWEQYHAIDDFWPEVFLPKCFDDFVGESTFEYRPNGMNQPCGNPSEAKVILNRLGFNEIPCPFG